jgi:hypothetical protein
MRSVEKVLERAVMAANVRALRASKDAGSSSSSSKVVTLGREDVERAAKLVMHRGDNYGAVLSMYA